MPTSLGIVFPTASWALTGSVPQAVRWRQVFRWVSSFPCASRFCQDDNRMSQHSFHGGSVLSQILAPWQMPGINRRKDSFWLMVSGSSSRVSFGSTGVRISWCDGTEVFVTARNQRGQEVTRRRTPREFLPFTRCPSSSSPAASDGIA